MKVHMIVNVEDFLDRYFQHKNGTVYQLKATCQTQLDNVWHDFVTYINKDGELFSRSKEDFFGESFKLLNLKADFETK